MVTMGRFEMPTPRTPVQMTQKHLFLACKLWLRGLGTVVSTKSPSQSGENAGRTLHHVAVVRVIKEFGTEVADGRLLKLPGGDLNV